MLETDEAPETAVHISPVWRFVVRSEVAAGADVALRAGLQDLFARSTD